MRQPAGLLPLRGRGASGFFMLVAVEPPPTMWHDLGVALCLVMVIEGLLPFASPERWRMAMQTMGQMDNRSLRIMGLVSMLIGAGLLTLINH